VHNGYVSVTVHRSNAPVTIQLQDGRGRLAASAYYRGLRCGVHRFAVPRPEAAAASGVFVLSVTNGDTRWTQQILSCGGRHGQAGSAPRPAVIARSSAPPVDYVDTLLLSASQKLNKRVGICMSYVNMDTVVLIDESLDLTSGTFPRIDGSTSAHPLRVIMACNLLGTSYSWGQWFDGTIRADAYSSTRPALADSIDTMCVNSGTHGAYVSLIEDSSDIVVVARRPSDDELALADSFDVMLDVRAVALDAFVFILNNRNPVSTLTLDEIRGIYTGQITNWSQVGGNDWAISPYQRNENSGSQELLYSMVMVDTPIMSAPDLVLPGMMGPINQLSADSAGIAYTVYFFKEFMAPSEFITMCGIDGIPPTYETISARSYPLWNEVYVVIREDTPVSHNAYRMRE
jgi:phosphate transport system substrate-binding protein